MENIQSPGWNTSVAVPIVSYLNFGGGVQWLFSSERSSTSRNLPLLSTTESGLMNSGACLATTMAPLASSEATASDTKSAYWDALLWLGRAVGGGGPAGPHCSLKPTVSTDMTSDEATKLAQKARRRRSR